MPKQDGRAAAIRAGLGTVMLLPAFTMIATRADAAEIVLPFALTTPRIVTLVVVLGVVGFALIAVAALSRARNRAEAENEALKARVADLKTAAERTTALLDDDRCRLVAWDTGGEAPTVAGALPAESGAPADRAAFLAFGTWLKPESAGRRAPAGE
jgi:hypothetical protein